MKYEAISTISQQEYIFENVVCKMQVICISLSVLLGAFNQLINHSNTVLQFASTWAPIPQINKVDAVDSLFAIN